MDTGIFNDMITLVEYCQVFPKGLSLGLFNDIAARLSFAQWMLNASVAHWRVQSRRSAAARLSSPPNLCSRTKR